jgi:hypothetical protein
MDRLRDVLDALLAHVVERVGEPIADVVADRARDADAARFGQPIQPRGDIDAVAVDVIAIDNHVAEIDADAEDDALILGDTRIAVDHRPLDFGRAADCVDDARKFHQHAVAGGFDDASVMLSDFRIDELAAMGLQALERAVLVGAHQPRIARHIGGQNRGETAFDGLFHSLSLPRR